VGVFAMQTMKAVYDNGTLVFPEGVAPRGRMEVVVVFPEQVEAVSNNLIEQRDKDAGKRFVREWSGILRGCNIDNWKDEKAAHLLKAR
jgi:hypothetical protein